MGQSAEKMAKENGITREEQDRIALHEPSAGRAPRTADGRLTAEIAPWFGGQDMDQVVDEDNGIRADTSLEALAKLKPVFDRTYGTRDRGQLLAAHRWRRGRAADGGGQGARRWATSRSPTSGATRLRRSIPGGSCSWARSTPCPKALERAGIQLERSRAGRNSRGLRRAGALQHAGLGLPGLGRSARAVRARWARWTGSAPTSSGGSIAIGHPFGATGARLVTTLANEMRRRDVQFGLISICAQGGMGYAMVLERR